MTRFEARPANLPEITELRAQHCEEANCQIVRYSILPRGLADAYVVDVGDTIVAYAGLWNAHFPGRLTEFYVAPEARGASRDIVEALRTASGATELEVQTNILNGRELLEGCASRSWVESYLFGEGPSTTLEVAGVTFRPRTESDAGPDGDWVADEQGRVVGAGGWLTHYNPPYADLHMEVVEEARGRGIGSYLVQEIRRECARAGLRVAARCSPSNEASRRALVRGGLSPVGEILVGELR